MQDPTPSPTTRVDAPSGALAGRTGRYEKRLRDLEGVFADAGAFAARLAADRDELVYEVEEFRPSEAAGDLIHGTSTLHPGRVGREFHMTRGHIHRVADRAEIYSCLAGHGLLLLEDPAGVTSLAELTPGVTAHVPPHHIHRSVNVGDEPLVTLFCYPADAGQDYGIIERSGGMRHLVTAAGGGWTAEANDAYVPRA